MWQSVTVWPYLNLPVRSLQLIIVDTYLHGHRMVCEWNKDRIAWKVWFPILLSIPFWTPSQSPVTTRLKFSNQAISSSPTKPYPSPVHHCTTSLEQSAVWAPHFFCFFTIILYLSIYIVTYIVPLQGSYSEALPAQARPKRRVLRSL